MSADSFTYSGSRIATDIKDKFGDVGGVQINDDMILRWINDGQRDVSRDNPFNQQIGTQDIVSGQAAYPFSGFTSARILQFDSVIVAGTPARVIPYPEFQQRIQLPGYQSALGDATTQQVFATMYGGNLIIWPTPQASTPSGLQLYYVGYPADLVSITDPLSVPDRFYNALQSYVFAQALMLDENWEAAKAVLAQSQADKQRESERENRSPNDFYPTIVDTESTEYQWSPGVIDYPLV